MPHNILKTEELIKLQRLKSGGFLSETIVDGPEHLNLQGQKLENLPGVDVDKLNEAARIMRGFIFATVEAARSGHPGGPSAKVEQFFGIVFLFIQMNFLENYKTNRGFQF